LNCHLPLGRVHSGCQDWDHGRLRSRYYWRRHQRRRHRARCGGTRAEGRTARAKQSRVRYVVRFVEADPWRLALSGTRRAAVGARRAQRARSAAADGAASDQAASLRVAARHTLSLAGRAQARAFHLRHDRPPRNPARHAQRRSRHRCDRRAAAAAFSSRLRVFRLLCRRCAARRAQCGRCRRTRRRDPHAHALCARRARRYLAARSQ
jgi:hypothetical protein